MNDERINRILTEYAVKYPPLITIDQAVEISRRPRSTIYDWSSCGLFNDIKARGRQVLLDRDGFVVFLITHNQKRA